eukprot:CAMPEP_0172206518 /NCGR_PEP_ID=MMETSP1050-20130122/33267_1 /TAXON_ID=233186 /ORGANISM="Cryptomonas curvata, Strain CCAP979/52" /LENGTH=537 /DNA_ID=CAMNT_0012885619 /DNA_START=783 /DNA_END=2392 /DNA_ORIENTATION=-
MTTVVIATIFLIVETEAIEWIVASNESLAKAIRNISFGDTVIVNDGLYLSCNQVIRASNVTIQAMSKMKVKIDCNQSTSHLIIYGENVRIKGIAFMNGFSVQSGGCVKVFGKGVMFQDCRFERCRSSFLGGGIFLSSTAGNVTIYNSEVIGCKAVFGGGVFTDIFVHLHIYGRIVFKENTASQSGGGMYLASSSRTTFDVEACDFHGNSANVDGGGIYLITASISISGEVTFSKNSASSAGALVLWASVATFESGSKISFKENSGGRFGGAVILASGSVLHSRSSVNFEGNYAGITGGAILIQGSNLITYAMSAMIFDRNKCSSGGALAGLGGSGNSSLDLDGSFQFRNNSSIDGGGLYAHKCNVILRGQLLFEGNRASRYGGGVSVWFSTLTTGPQSALQCVGNRANVGGGMLLVASTIKAQGSVVLSNNSAIDFGGGLMVDSSSWISEGQVSFTGNTAKAGAGLSIGYSLFVVLPLSIVEFTDNRAAQGGAVDAAVSQLAIYARRSSFSGNAAETFGGAMCLVNSTLEVGGNCTV